MRSLALAYGFLASQEVKDAGLGNFGLWDRMSLPTLCVSAVTDNHPLLQNVKRFNGFRRTLRHSAGTRPR